MSSINLHCSNNKKNKKIKVHGNLAQYWGEKAEKYKNQAGSYATTAATEATLAMDWAIKTDGTVADGEYSSKYYAQQTASILNEATTTIDALKTDAVSVISSTTSAATTAGLGSITTATTSATSSIEAVGTSVVSATTSSTSAIATEAIGSVNDAKTSALTTINGAKTDAINTINTLKTEATTTINGAKTAALSTINTTGTSYVNQMTTIKNQTTTARDEALIWAEGSDAQVQALGGTHSAKEWCRYNSSVNQNDVRALESGLHSGELYQEGDSDSIDSRLAEITENAHSTFDSSKFTVIGSPIVTSDGIASGFSDSNYLTLTDLSEYIPNGCTNFKLSLQYVCTGLNIGILFGDKRRYVTDQYVPYGIWSEIKNNKILFIVGDGSTVQIVTSNTSVTTNTKYNIEYVADGTNYKIYINGNLDISVPITQTLSYDVTDKSILIGKCYGVADYYLRGSIDLKQFSITVDGIPVFSGNKTGIDTIKPNDYTVVGTPVISADGIASGFSDNSYIDIPAFQAIGNEPFEIIIKVNTGTSGTNRNICRFGTGVFTTIRIADNNRWQVWAKLTDNTEISNNLSSPANSVPANTDLYFKFAWNGSRYFIADSSDGKNWTERSIYNSSLKLSRYDTQGLSIGHVSTGINLTSGSIDLNAFKVYVDGDLVYQPCLKIPYTKSKTGSKIVNSIYRDRVNDMANQFGYAPYYTLSDSDFTLPQGELYGNIQQTLRNTKQNGISKNYLYSDRMQIQTGSCTSGTEVTLPVPFADANYALTVPYSAKTATKFTPTQTGDWIAIGLGVL